MCPLPYLVPSLTPPKPGLITHSITANTRSGLRIADNILLNRERQPCVIEELHLHLKRNHYPVSLSHFYWHFQVIYKNGLFRVFKRTMHNFLLIIRTVNVFNVFQTIRIFILRKCLCLFFNIKHTLKTIVPARNLFRIQGQISRFCAEAN